MMNDLIDVKMLLLITSVTIGYLYITSDNNIILKKYN
jgi:hypothetical protein